MGLTAIHRTVLERLVAHSDEQVRCWQEAVPTAERAATVFGASEQIGDALRRMSEKLLQRDLPRLQTGISDAPVVPFFSLLQRGGYYSGEDVSFCQRCHDAGIPVQLDTRVRVYHKGSYCYGLEDVGMEVPYCHQLISRHVDEPQPAAAPPNAAVQRALESELAEGKAKARELEPSPSESAQ
jgi:hypothetical protein